jgi:hypothetical protein
MRLSQEMCNYFEKRLAIALGDRERATEEATRCHEDARQMTVRAAYYDDAVRELGVIIDGLRELIASVPREVG